MNDYIIETHNLTKKYGSQASVQKQQLLTPCGNP